MTYSPVTRLLTVLDLLQSRPGVTAAQLAERLEVEARSVRRYITMLQDIGIPVEAALALSLLKRARDITIGVPVLWSWQVLESRRLRAKLTAGAQNAG